MEIPILLVVLLCASYFRSDAVLSLLAADRGVSVSSSHNVVLPVAMTRCWPCGKKNRKPGAAAKDAWLSF